MVHTAKIWRYYLSWKNENTGIYACSTDFDSDRRIVICDGSEDPTEQCNGLLLSLALARRKLRCSFLPQGERQDVDIEGAIREFAAAKSTPFFRFRAIYEYFG